MLRQLKSDYRDDNVLFIEQDVDAPLGGRLDRWWIAYNNPGTVYLPLVMVDSGRRISNGSEDFRAVYSLMVDGALQRPAEADMTASAERIGSVLRIDLNLTNRSGVTLSATNQATLTALAWEEPSDPDSVPIVTATRVAPVATLADGATRSFTLEVAAGDLDPDRTRWVVIADYQPLGGSNPFDTQQAVAGP